jgi:ribosomal protein S27AE
MKRDWTGIAVTCIVALCFVFSVSLAILPYTIQMVKSMSECEPCECEEDELEPDVKIENGVETRSYSDYQRNATTRSIVDGKTVRYVSHFVCPRCGESHKLLEHGESIVCSCGLQLQVWGNGLECTEAKSEDNTAK